MYPTTSIKNNISEELRKMMDIISYSDRKTSIIEIADKLSMSIRDLNRIIYKLEKKKLIRKVL